MSDTSILFFGDVHGHYEHVLDAVTLFEPKAIVLLGDLQPEAPLHEVLAPILTQTEIWFIHGNHDTDSDTDYDHVFGSELKDRNLHGRVVEIAGVRIAGLGGVFRGQVWSPPEEPNFESAKEFAAKCGKGNLWRGGLPRKHHSTIFPQTYHSLAKQRADILVTHEAPSAHHNGFEALDELGRSLRIEKSFHGHHHDCKDYRTHDERLGFKAFGVGCCGVSDLDGETVLSGHHDHLRYVISSRDTGYDEDN